ncbi:PcfK-like protein [Dysgonomonas alginatilytica]|uniref:PcfK-like protein n=1 Tax=Dysgonomonas alginatilytica TaxID=1605892 RepID=A0A2V3PPE0_9BACT|nr:PcfK-like family protein [Dysgonomonas alginatilytica]PXV63285.1 PcfK-like protein [Dysgonomonas alginatilytica]
MKSTAYFTRTILTHLEQKAETNTLFAQSFANPDKDIDQCCLFILNQVQKSGCNGFHDNEIFSIAEDYYTTDNIEVGNPIHAQITVNHVVELTVEEKEEARQEAIQKAHNEAYNRAMQPKKKAKRVEMNNQPSLFDF